MCQPKRDGRDKPGHDVAGTLSLPLSRFNVQYLPELHQETSMAQQRLGIIMNGVTGRMGMNQHLIRSIMAIRAEGGVLLGAYVVYLGLVLSQG
jgi:hypothetical protein